MKTIGIVAPAGALKKEDLKKAINFIENCNWKYKLSENLFNNYYFGYNYSGTIKQRLDDLQNFINDDSIDVIWCARGGYGTVQLIDDLDFSPLLNKNKLIVGYSDNTVLHQALNNLGIASIHGITAKELPSKNTDDSYESLKFCIENLTMNYQIKTSSLNNLGNASGILVGGNLSIIVSLLGSKTITNFKNKILFLEDWKENFYSIDRMINCLKRAGIFDNLNGLIFGGFTKLENKEDNKNFDNPFDSYALKIIKKIIGNRNYPIIYKFPSGHISDNKAIIMGKETEILIDKNKTILKTI